MTNCPNCGKAVDPLLAPAVVVREGKVVPFCSKECAAAMETKPTKLIPTKMLRLPTNPGTPASGVPLGTTPSLDSGPVIEIVREGSQPAAKDATPPRKKRPDSQSVQIADTGHLDDYVTHEPKRRGVALAIAGLILVGGGLGAAYLLGAFGTHRDAPVAVAVRSDAAVEKPVVVDGGPSAISSDAALARAQDVLRAQMKSDSPRVQRVAASALARTGDKAALELLATALTKETGDLAKLDLAYALGRAGDKRGLDALTVAARGAKRDPKLEAGRRLALLGDKRAIDVLASYLDVSQLRLGIAEQLAFLAEPRALKVLDEVRADPKAVPDEKARATIALGRAGRADIQPALRELLADDRNNAFAAVALADFKDDSARPVLVKQLTIPSLRVQAARSLRRLAPDADVSSLLPPLVGALDSNKDTEQVQIAESILLLAGPPAWSERE